MCWAETWALRKTPEESKYYYLSWLDPAAGSPSTLVGPQLDLAPESPGELARPNSPTARNQKRTFPPASQPRPPSKRTVRSLAGCAGVAARPEFARPASAPRQI